MKRCVKKWLDIPDEKHCGDCEFIDDSEEDRVWCLLHNEFLEVGEDKLLVRARECLASDITGIIDDEPGDEEEDPEEDLPDEDVPEEEEIPDEEEE